MKFLPTFAKIFGHLPTFCGLLPTFVKVFDAFLRKNCKKIGHLPTFCPLLKMDLATKNRLFMRV